MASRDPWGPDNPLRTLRVAAIILASDRCRAVRGPLADGVTGYDALDLRPGRLRELEEEANALPHPAPLPPPPTSRDLAARRIRAAAGHGPARALRGGFDHAEERQLTDMAIFAAVDRLWRALGCHLALPDHREDL